MDGPFFLRRTAQSGSVLRASALVLALAHMARGGDHEPRVLPANAIQPAGASYAGYPVVGQKQNVEIVKEILSGTASQWIHHPVCATALGARRFTERLAVRAVEVAPPVFSKLRSHLGECCQGDSCISDLGGEAGGPPLPARLTLVPTCEASLQSLMGVIASAQHRIDIMIYGWDDDPTGREVGAALAAKARVGVRVRVLVDRTAFLIHNASAARGECTFLDALSRTPNVTVIEPKGACMRFDHRKLAVVDDRIVWSGGMILTEVARRRWHDFTYRAEGPVVAQFAAAFAERWHEQGGASEGPCPGRPIQRLTDANATVRLIRTDTNERSIKDAIYHAVDHARCSIYLENPYFADQILVKKLIAARQRGVDVRAIMTLRGNLPDGIQFAHLTANRLLRGGVRVWLYPGMTHVKAMSADGVWAYIGTANFDELSFRNNREIGLSVTNRALVSQLNASLFLHDMAVSQELTALLPPVKERLKLALLGFWY